MIRLDGSLPGAGALCVRTASIPVVRANERGFCLELDGLERGAPSNRALQVTQLKCVRVNYSLQYF
jgi:hypothetical protein